MEAGRFFALLGPSGCGKTTTLRMIGGFEDPSSGAIYLGDTDVVGLPPYKRDVNTVFQSYALFPHLSIFENVAFGMRRQGVRGTQLAGRVREILKLVDLEGMEKRKPRQLSGGQQQRVALARALVNKPDVLLLDEPLGRARPQAPQADAARAEDDPARRRDHVRPRHARPGGGDDDGGHDRGHEQGPDRAARPAGRALRAAENRLRRGLPRGLEPARGHRLRPGRDHARRRRDSQRLPGRAERAHRPRGRRHPPGEDPHRHRRPRTRSTERSSSAHTSASRPSTSSTPPPGESWSTSRTPSRASGVWPAPGDPITVGFDPEATFVVDLAEEEMA